MIAFQQLQSARNELFVRETRGEERTWKEIEVGCTPMLDIWGRSEKAISFAAASHDRRNESPVGRQRRW